MKDETNDAERLDDYSYTTIQLGVWRMLLPVELTSSQWSPLARFPLSRLGKWDGLSPALLIWRFVREVYSIDPWLNLMLFALTLASAVEGTLLLYASSRLLRTVETGLVTGRPDIQAIWNAVILRVFCTALTSTSGWARGWVTPILRRRVISHFGDYIFQETLRLDISTIKDKNSKVEANANSLWNHFQFLCGLFRWGFRLASQIIFTAQQPSGGITLTLLALVSPILTTILRQVSWNRPFLCYASNLDYVRSRALKAIGSETYREEITSGNIGSWVLDEYKRARHALGTISDHSPHSQMATTTNPISGIFHALSADLPTFYWAASVVIDPSGFSITSFAILQQHAQAIRGTVSSLFNQFSRVAETVNSLQNLYKLADVTNKVVDGEEPYPNSTLSTDKGMTFELRNVSFAYPGGKSKENAIRNLSLKILAGQLVVIVGANGSGKSTIIKLLNRLYDVDSGEILVDGIPIQNYRLSDLRKAQALLTQDHKLFPLTLAENIGLGNPERVDDMQMVLQAAEAGGAAELIKKLEDGVQTTLSPVQTAYGYGLEKYKTLKSMLENMEREANVSGGEKQRLVAARTFMRFLSGGIRFAVADEPSSALDPKAEYQLFQRLRESGDGKTLVFVTHRFGHLTKHADLIICMKDGQAVETGTHKELLALGGEYSELYNVQAQAFSEDTG